MLGFPTSLHFVFLINNFIFRTVVCIGITFSMDMDIVKNLVDNNIKIDLRSRFKMGTIKLNMLSIFMKYSENYTFY